MGGVGSTPQVWTDTDILGENISGGAASCLDWTSNDEHEFGYFGSAESTGAAWTLANFDECGNAKRLYCIQY